MIFLALSRAEHLHYPIFLKLAALAKSIQALLLQFYDCAMGHIIVWTASTIPLSLSYIILHLLYHFKKHIVDRHNGCSIESDCLRTLSACFKICVHK